MTTKTTMTTTTTRTISRKSTVVAALTRAGCIVTSCSDGTILVSGDVEAAGRIIEARGWQYATAGYSSTLEAKPRRRR